MTGTNEKSTASGLVGEVYKNVKMGADLTVNLMPHVRDDELRLEMTRELDGYEALATRGAALLSELGESPKEENLLTRTSAKVGVAMNTMSDSSGSHIAEMMIQGTVMGVTDLRRRISAAEESVTGEAITLARDALKFEEDSAEKLKRFL